MAQWVDRGTDDRVVAGSYPTQPLGNLGNFLYATLPVSFQKDTKCIWSLLVSMPGEVKHPTQAVNV